MSMTSQPVRVFPAMASHGNPAGVPAISAHTCARAFARARAILSSMAAVPASSRARRTVGPLGACPEDRGQVGEQRDVAHARGARARSRPPSRPARSPGRAAVTCPSSAAPRSGAAVSPAWSAALRSRTAPAWPTSPSRRGDLQGMVPPVMRRVAPARRRAWGPLRTARASRSRHAAQASREGVSGGSCGSGFLRWRGGETCTRLVRSPSGGLGMP